MPQIGAGAVPSQVGRGSALGSASSGQVETPGPVLPSGARDLFEARRPRAMQRYVQQQHCNNTASERFRGNVAAVRVHFSRRARQGNSMLVALGEGRGSARSSLRGVVGDIRIGGSDALGCFREFSSKLEMVHLKCFDLCRGGAAVPTLRPRARFLATRDRPLVSASWSAFPEFVGDRNVHARH